MIAALAALPMAESIVGGVVGSVASVFSPPSERTAPAPPNSVPFTAALTEATKNIHTVTGSTGIMLANQWNQMSSADQQSWAQSLSGRHIDATDYAGHTVSGVVNGVTPSGATMSLNVGGHLVALSDLKQLSWSPAA